MKIVALLDDSRYATSVCDHAGWFGRLSEAEVELLHVMAKPSAQRERSDLSGSIGLGARSKLLDELTELDSRSAHLIQEHARLLLEGGRARIEASYPDLKVTERLRYGDLVETLEEFESDADLIVLGKRGEGAENAPDHVGSNLERVVRSGHKPVLVASRAFRPIERILIAWDGGNSSARAIEHLSNSRVFTDQGCTLLHVSDKADPGLDVAADKMRKAGFTVDAKRVPGKVEEVISRSVKEGEHHLLVMGAYGHSRIRQFIIGSTTTEMIRSCAVPLLLFH